MSPEETIYDDDLRYEDEPTPRKVLDTQVFKEPIKWKAAALWSKED